MGIEPVDVSVGALLRKWRRRRNLSQLALAGMADVSTRHLSCVESGKAAPSRTLLHALAEQLEMPLREENRLLLAAGFAPTYPENRLEDASMAQVNEAINAILDGSMPFPAVVVDHGWDLVAANDSAYRLMQGVPSWLLEPPVNVVRLSLHPQGLAPSILNRAEWHSAMVSRLAREHRQTGDDRLEALIAEVAGFGEPARPGQEPHPAPLVVPLRLRHEGQVLNLLTTTTVFGTPRDVTLSELAIECFYPADEATRDTMLAWSSAGGEELTA